VRDINPVCVLSKVCMETDGIAKPFLAYSKSLWCEPACGEERHYSIVEEEEKREREQREKNEILEDCRLKSGNVCQALPVASP
jgi:hypothetical protein